MSILTKLFGDPNSKTVKQIKPTVKTINDLEAQFTAKSDAELQEYTKTLKTELKSGQKVDDILPEAFALIREASKRTLSQRHFDVQLIGGIVLNSGKIAEMRTGEGKTLVATLPVFLNALTGKGVHVVTVNDYLAKRDAVWMGQIYDFLGLSVGIIAHESSFRYGAHLTSLENQLDKPKDDSSSFLIEHDYLIPCTRQEAYAADITYGTNNEFGFDYLRDNMAQKLEQVVQRELNFAVVDEVDSILIDEARTPLIISAPDAESPALYQKFAGIIPSLQGPEDYTVDEKMKAVSITEDGIDKVEKMLGITNIYEERGIAFVHHLEQALKAQALFQKDKDYVVKDGEVIIVDEFTGRMMPGRRYSEGLHQALEAKEKVAIQQESKTLATITFQNYFRLYDKLAGMTGTAVTSAEEFHKVYNLDVVVIPTNNTIQRNDLGDHVYKNEEAKFRAVARDVKARQQNGQPSLVGTVSIQKSEYISQILEVEGVKHNILNAKNHEKEGELIAAAGMKGAVTIATNMAGRGVDIKLGGPQATEEQKQEIMKVGGLHVIGTERHEARRIDNQLRGRSGRQGESGSTQFYLSLEDDVMRIFGGDRIQGLMERFKFPEDEPIQNILISKSIESAQSKIEGFNFDTRKHLLEYDDVMNKQREIIYRKRKDILKDALNIDKQTQDALQEQVYRMISFHTTAEMIRDWNTDKILEDVSALAPIPEDAKKVFKAIQEKPISLVEKRQEIKAYTMEIVENGLKAKFENADPQQIHELQKYVLLSTIDLLWMEHLELIDYLKTGIRLRGYAQRDPLIEYKNEAFDLFEKLLYSISEKYIETLLKMDVHFHVPEVQAPITIETNNDQIEQSLTGTLVDSQTESKNKSKPTKSSSKDAHKNIRRNDPCWCGSGKKFKKCHGK